MNADAFNIRKNDNLRIDLPEWTPGKSRPEESPADYALRETSGNTIIVQAKFCISPASARRAEIKAEGGGVLGELDAQAVDFNNGISHPEFVSFPLTHATMAATGITREDIVWNWKYRCAGETEWIDMQTTNHRIYVVLAEPTLPWKQLPFPDQAFQNPWTDALDFACTWAAGMTAPVDAAAAVTSMVNSSLGLNYDMASGAPAYTPNAGIFFELTDFIDLISGLGGLGNVVNCTDCATIVTTFANVLGCDLHASRMAMYFDLTEIKAIGQPAWGCPNWGCRFSFHEVAWTGQNADADPIFDACLEVDGDDDPWSAPHTALLPVNIPFTTLPGAALPLPTPFTVQTYRERLCTNNSGGIGSCNSVGPWPGSNGGRRQVR